MDFEVQTELETPPIHDYHVDPYYTTQARKDHAPFYAKHDSASANISSDDFCRRPLGVFYDKCGHCHWPCVHLQAVLCQKPHKSLRE